MPHLTKLTLTLTLDPGTTIDQIDHIPADSEDTFQQISPTQWRGEFIITCPTAPELSPGDFEDDLAPHIRDLHHHHQTIATSHPPRSSNLCIPSSTLAPLPSSQIHYRKRISLN